MGKTHVLRRMTSQAVPETESRPAWLQLRESRVERWEVRAGRQAGSRRISRVEFALSVAGLH